MAMKPLLLGAMSALAASGLLAAGALAAETQRGPRVLDPIAGGSWEVTQLESKAKPRRFCVRDVSLLAQYEHMGTTCTRVTVNEGPRKALVRYTCPAGGFGTSGIEVVTPRSLNIETQGIKDGQPFNRRLLARRVGGC